MINKENLDIIIKDVTWSYEEGDMDVPQNILDTLNEMKQIQSILNEYNVTPENIREVLLTGQMFRNQQTFEECIKEWEEKGFKCIRFSNALKFENKSEDITINIQEWNGSVMITDSNYCYARNISYDLHNLINKTLKALEVEND